MSALFFIAAALTATANAGAAAADFVRAQFVLDNSAEVGVPTTWLPTLGALKALGAAGLVAGMFGDVSVAVAAAVGLSTFFVGAVLVHVRSRVFHNIAAPLLFLALAVTTLLLAIDKLPD